MTYLQNAYHWLFLISRRKIVIKFTLTRLNSANALPYSQPLFMALEGKNQYAM